MPVPRLILVACVSLIGPALAAPVRADIVLEGETAGPGDASYVRYGTDLGGVDDLISADVDPDFFASDVTDPPPAPGPIGRPEVDAGLPPTVPRPAFARPGYVASNEAPWEWHLLPGDPMFKSFIAGVHAQRMAGELVGDDDQGALLDTTIGGRIALFRKGTLGPDAEGWEFQVAGAALTRLAMDRESDVEAVDYNFATPLVYRSGPTAYRFGYDHISSHVGDEYLIKNPRFHRVNYVRDALEFAAIHDLTDAVAVYGEANYAFHNSGGSEPWHFQFGAEFEPEPVPGRRGAPVAAVNTLLREEFGYEGNLGVVAGWQWRGEQRDDLLRLALTLYTGRSRQFSFFDRHETLTGAGLYYDF